MMDAAIEEAAVGAAPGAAKAAKAVARQFVSFTIDEELYGVDVMAVREIRKWSPTTGLPGQPYYCRGVLNIRGEALPVHDLRARFGGGETEASENHVVVIVNLPNGSVGLLVDTVSDILDVDPSEVCAVPEGARDSHDGSITGLVPRDDKMMALVDVATLF
jgi:purine-binding chemotaxis protein CheW